MVLTLAGNAVGGIFKIGATVGGMLTGQPIIIALKLYLKFCVISSIFLSLFMLGGIIAPLIGIVYVYYMLYQRMVCWSKNIPDSKCKVFN